MTEHPDDYDASEVQKIKDLNDLKIYFQIIPTLNKFNHAFSEDTPKSWETFTTIGPNGKKMLDDINLEYIDTLRLFKKWKELQNAEELEDGTRHVVETLLENSHLINTNQNENRQSQFHMLHENLKQWIQQQENSNQNESTFRSSIDTKLKEQGINNNSNDMSKVKFNDLQDYYDFMVAASKFNNYFNSTYETPSKFINHPNKKLFVLKVSTFPKIDEFLSLNDPENYKTANGFENNKSKIEEKFKEFQNKYHDNLLQNIENEINQLKSSTEKYKENAKNIIETFMAQNQNKINISMKIIDKYNNITDLQKYLNKEAEKYWKDKINANIDVYNTLFGVSLNFQTLKQQYGTNYQEFYNSMIQNIQEETTRQIQLYMKDINIELKAYKNANPSSTKYDGIEKFESPDFTNENMSEEEKNRKIQEIKENFKKFGNFEDRFYKLKIENNLNEYNRWYNRWTPKGKKPLFTDTLETLLQRHPKLYDCYLHVLVSSKIVEYNDTKRANEEEMTLEKLKIQFPASNSEERKNQPELMNNYLQTEIDKMSKEKKTDSYEKIIKDYNLDNVSVEELKKLGETPKIAKFKILIQRILPTFLKWYPNYKNNSVDDIIENLCKTWNISSNINSEPIENKESLLEDCYYNFLFNPMAKKYYIAYGKKEWNHENDFYMTNFLVDKLSENQYSEDIDGIKNVNPIEIEPILKDECQKIDKAYQILQSQFNNLTPESKGFVNANFDSLDDFIQYFGSINETKWLIKILEILPIWNQYVDDFGVDSKISNLQQIITKYSNKDNENSENYRQEYWNKILTALFENYKKAYHIPREENLDSFKEKILKGNNDDDDLFKGIQTLNPFNSSIVNSNDKKLNSDEFLQKVKSQLEKFIEQSNISYTNLQQEYQNVFGKVVEIKDLKKHSWIEVHYSIEIQRYQNSHPDEKINVNNLVAKYKSFENAYWNLRTEKDRKEYNKYCSKVNEQVNNFDDIKKLLNFTQTFEPKSLNEYDQEFEDLVIKFNQKVEDLKLKYYQSDLKNAATEFISIDDAKNRLKIADPEKLYWALKTRQALKKYNEYFKTQTHTFENLRDKSNEDWETLYWKYSLEPEIDKYKNVFKGTEELTVENLRRKYSTVEDAIKHITALETEKETKKKFETIEMKKLLDIYNNLPKTDNLDKNDLIRLWETPENAKFHLLIEPYLEEYNKLSNFKTLTPEECDKIVSKRDEWDKQNPNATEEQIESMIHDSEQGYLNRNELAYQIIVYPKLLNAQKMIPQFDVNNFTKQHPDPLDARKILDEIIQKSEIGMTSLIQEYAKHFPNSTLQTLKTSYPEPYELDAHLRIDPLLFEIQKEGEYKNTKFKFEDIIHKKYDKEGGYQENVYEIQDKLSEKLDEIKEIKPLLEKYENETTIKPKSIEEWESTFPDKIDPEQWKNLRRNLLKELEAIRQYKLLSSEYESFTLENTDSVQDIAKKNKGFDSIDSKIFQKEKDELAKIWAFISPLKLINSQYKEIMGKNYPFKRLYEDTNHNISLAREKLQRKVDFLKEVKPLHDELLNITKDNISYDYLIENYFQDITQDDLETEISKNNETKQRNIKDMAQGAKDFLKGKIDQAQKKKRDEMNEINNSNALRNSYSGGGAIIRPLIGGGGGGSFNRIQPPNQLNQQNQQNQQPQNQLNQLNQNQIPPFHYDKSNPLSFRIQKLNYMKMIDGLKNQGTNSEIQTYTQINPLISNPQPKITPLTINPEPQITQPIQITPQPTQSTQPTPQPIQPIQPNTLSKKEIEGILKKMKIPLRYAIQLFNANISKDQLKSAESIKNIISNLKKSKFVPKKALRYNLLNKL